MYNLKSNSNDTCSSHAHLLVLGRQSISLLLSLSLQASLNWTETASKAPSATTSNNHKQNIIKLRPIDWRGGEEREGGRRNGVEREKKKRERERSGEVGERGGVWITTSKKMTKMLSRCNPYSHIAHNIIN